MSRWLRRYGPTTGRGIRLFCFPYAGGGASMYRNWALPDHLDAEVWAVQPPGRENRWSEPALRRLEPVVDGVVAELSRLTDRPYAFFGHSMGALTAFEVARRMRSEQGRAPCHLFVSAHRAPDLPPRREPVSRLPPARFAARLAEMADGSRLAVQDEELIRLMEPTLRADFEVCESYRHRADRPLDMPVTGFVAVDDPEVDVDEVAEWWRHSTGPFDLHTFSGGHLFVRDREADVVDIVAGALTGRTVPDR